MLYRRTLTVSAIHIYIKYIENIFFFRRRLRRRCSRRCRWLLAASLLDNVAIPPPTIGGQAQHTIFSCYPAFCYVLCIALL